MLRVLLGEINGVTGLGTWRIYHLRPLTRFFTCTTGISYLKIENAANLSSNIDRLLAIYQTLYPNNWFLPSDKPSSESSLKPFYHTFPEGTTRLYNSDDVRNWTQYGYQYDMLQHQPGESQDEYITRINAWVKSNYGGTAKLLVKDPKKLFEGVNIQDHTYDDYIIDVIYDRYDFPSHYSL